MDTVGKLVNRFAKRDGLNAASKNDQFGPGPEDIDCLWSFSSNGKPIDGLQELCDAEIIGYLHQWKEITDEELKEADKELFGESRPGSDMPRCPYGNESYPDQICSTCPNCKVKAGELHKPGCPLESCPLCGQKILTCSCKALSIADGIATAGAVSKRISRQEVHQALQHSEKLDRTYHEEGCLHFIVDDLCKRDPEAMAKMDGFISDIGFKQVNGGVAITAEQLAENMGISVEEADDALREIQVKSQFPGWEKHCHPV
ncbi:hypothetical protein [Desulfopila sp. IMCC35008]|uniref:hypothetical protein n=1 Tax=Desulfopila sp. IMCC35008 TaxID=2653858 RepID=UPI0013D6CF6F|nr:hypothetical protein [Desulfopila sp. IMCC35008]